jgi:citrate lyase subunit beta/citryl-CoA lyase
VILDLEDAVAPADKAAARESLIASDLDPDRTIVRVNPIGTDAHARDLRAVDRTAFRALMVAKAENAGLLDQLSDFRIIALIETATGVENVTAIAQHASVIGLMWGAEDLIASMSGRSSRFADGGYRDVARYARARTLIAARAAGKLAIDAVHVEIGDVAGLQAEVEDAAASGFSATACIHPSQTSVIRAGYAPAPKELDWARRVLDEATRQAGVFRFEGRMVDEPVLRQAAELLRVSADQR